MARGNEIGVAYYSLVPSMDGTAAAVNSQLGVVTGASAAVGRKGGVAMGAGLAGGLKAAGTIGLALGAVGLLSSVTDYFRDSVGLASDLQESANALSVTFGEQSEQISQLGETAATRLGLSNIAFNQLATQFSAFAGTIAGEGGDVVGVIDELTTRGADFASVYNLDVNEALRLFQSGLAGETEPLRRYGLDLSAASVEAFALANGIGNATGTLTEAEKVQARYGLLLQQTAKTQGDFANTSDSLANSQRIANAQFENAQARIGEALLPAAEKFSAWMLEDGVPLVERLVDLFIELEPAISFVVDLFLQDLEMRAGVLGATLDLIDALEDGTVTLEEFRAAFVQLPEPLQEAIIGITQFMLDLGLGIYNFVAGGLNGILGFVNGILDAYRPLANLFGIQLPRLGRFAELSAGSVRNQLLGVDAAEFTQGAGGRVAMAEGGVVRARPGGVAATVGEGRFDEAVIPLSPSVLSQLGAAIGGGDRPIYMDGSIVGVLREVANREAELVLSGAVTGLGFDMRAGGVV
jgi:hypothetical protein